MKALKRLVPMLAVSLTLLLHGCNSRDGTTEPLTNKPQSTQTNTSNPSSKTEPVEDVAKQVKPPQQQETITIQQQETLTTISRKAALLKIGMTYREAVAMLGRMPDTVVNDQIREELGETTHDNNLITFEWKNDNANCHSVSVDFDPSDMTLTGVDEGRVCAGPGITSEPFGKTCAETTLCKLE